jgi:hypothetical protein
VTSLTILTSSRPEQPLNIDSATTFVVNDGKFQLIGPFIAVQKANRDF